MSSMCRPQEIMRLGGQEPRFFLTDVINSSIAGMNQYLDAFNEARLIHRRQRSKHSASTPEALILIEKAGKRTILTHILATYFTKFLKRSTSCSIMSELTRKARWETDKLLLVFKLRHPQEHVYRTKCNMSRAQIAPTDYMGLWVSVL